MDEQKPTEQVFLPDDWKENVASQYERFTGDSGKAVIVILDVKKEYNTKFKRPEYQWRIYKVNKSGILTEKILTESSKRFCSALSSIDKLHPVVGTDEYLWVEWLKSKDSKNREVKEWNVKRIDPKDISETLKQL